MAKPDIFVVIPKNVAVPFDLIATCKRFNIPIVRSPDAESGIQWNVPGAAKGVPVCGDENLVDGKPPTETPTTKCYHRIVRIDYALGKEWCGNPDCGHVFKAFPPVTPSCKEPDSICAERCVAA